MPKKQQLRILTVLLLLVCTSVMVLGVFCNVHSEGTSSVEYLPERIIAWGSGEAGLESWGSGGDYLYGASVEPTTLDVWKWKSDALQKSNRCRVTDKNWLSIAGLANGRFLIYAWQDDARLATVYLRDGSTGQTIGQFPKEKGWCERLSRPSQNGKFVAVWAFPDVDGPKTTGMDELFRLGLIEPEIKKIEWGPMLSGAIGVANVRRAIPSDDGIHVAVAGWQHGAAVVSIPEKKCLWQKRPQNEVCFTDIAFSPDNKLVYVGGGEGCVYGMKVQDGEIVSQWWASPTGKSEYGHRISTISVSPDGRFVAAGTGPEGQVYLFSTKDGKRRILNHGGSTILITSFSPDSKRLASFAAGKIKIWKLPEEEASPKTDKVAETKEAAK